MTGYDIAMVAYWLLLVFIGGMIFQYIREPRTWKVIHEDKLIDEEGSVIGRWYVLQDQNGRIKKRKLRS